MPKLARNTAFLITGQIISQTFTAMTGIVIARSIGQSGYGEYSLAFAFVTALGAFFSFGSDSILIREVAQKSGEAGKIFSTGLWLRTISFPLTILIIMATASILGYSSEQKILILLVMVTFGLSTGTDLPRAIFIGIQRMELDALSRSAEKLIILLIVAILVILLQVIRLPVIVAGMAFGASLGILFSWWLLKRKLTAIPYVPVQDSIWLWRASTPIFISILVISVSVQLPVIILSRFVPVEQVGLYNAAYNTIAPFVLVAVAFSLAILPLISVASRSAYAIASLAHSRFFIYCLVISLPLAVILQWFGKEILYLLFGVEFIPAASIISVLAWYLPTVFLNLYLTNAMISVGYQARLIWVTTTNLTVTIILGLVLVPILGAIGAAITVLTAATVSVGFYLILLWPKVRLQLNFNFVLLLLASLGMLAAGTRIFSMPLAIRIITTIFLYFVVLSCSGIFKFTKLQPTVFPLE